MSVRRRARSRHSHNHGVAVGAEDNVALASTVDSSKKAHCLPLEVLEVAFEARRPLRTSVVAAGLQEVAPAAGSVKGEHPQDWVEEVSF